MNRTTVVFLALAILLAHTLAIHQTPDGRFGAPYERAHVAYRVGRNLAFEGRATWDVQAPSAETYPSPLWVGLGALAVELEIPPTTLSQVLGILCALCTVGVVAQFSSNRLAGLVAPVLIATSGSACASAASGTEAPLAMLLVASAFLAFERGWRGLFASSSIALLLTRPEGAFLVSCFLLLEICDRPREEGPRRSLAGALALVFGAGIAFLCLRRGFTGSFSSPFDAELLRFDAERWNLGFHYVWSFVIASGSGALFVLPVGFLLRGRLPPSGRRALALFTCWTLVVALAGGDRQPFWNVLAPALPLLFLGIQESITAWIDRNPRQAPLAWLLLSVTTVASFLVSKVPGNLGPLPLEGFLRAWMEPDSVLSRAFEHPLGRLGLLSEIREVERLRSAGIFLRDQVSADATIGTFWPGAIGYLSRKQVVDLLGRTPSADRGGQGRPWEGAAKVDLVGALSSPTNYLVLEAGVGERPSASELFHEWLRRYDTVGDVPERFHALLESLQRYELVSVPVPERSSRPDVPSSQPFLLLRERSLGLAPRLELSRSGSEVEILAHHRGHAQVVDLELRLVDSGGRSWNMRPTGAWTPANSVDARIDLLLYDTGPSSILLARTALPRGMEAATLTARLHTPGIAADSTLATVATASLELQR